MATTNGSTAIRDKILASLARYRALRIGKFPCAFWRLSSRPGLTATEFDPALGMIHGGFIPFGGGLALYNSDWQIVGGLGVSGSSACEDHVVAWRVRGFAELDYVPSGPSGTFDDDLVFKSVKSTHGWGHPDCLGTHAEREAQAMLKSVMLKDTLPDDRLDIR